MADGPPSNLQSLDARLRNHCENTGRNFSRARRHIGALVVARLLRGSDTVVKGGRHLEIRYGLAATRASTDVDLVRVPPLQEILDHLEDALSDGWAGFTGRLGDRGGIQTPVPPDYRPHRLDVKLDFEGRSFGTVQLEVASEEAGGLRTTDTIESADGGPIFEAIGLPNPGPVSVLTLPVQVAQKLHACTAPDTGGWTNDRAHDLVDLQLIDLDLDVAQLSEVREACERLFRARTGHGWPPTLTAREGWSARYAEERTDVRSDVLGDLEQAIGWANDFIARIAEA
jgi:hypothetical protein